MRHHIFIWVYTVCSGLSGQGKVQLSISYGKSHAETTGKIMTKSLVITNRLSITMAGLIIMLIIFSALISQPYAKHINYNKICAQHILEYIAQHIPKYVHST